MTTTDPSSVEVDVPKIISVDDHVIEPAHLFDRWLPKRFRENAPRIVRANLKSLTIHGGLYEMEVTDGGEGVPSEFWSYDDKLIPIKRTNAGVGLPLEEITSTGMLFEEMRPGCYDPAARIADMDLNWTEASMCFPTMPRFCGQTFLEAQDRELALACVRAYNDWMVEEWCGDSGGRLIPLCLIPLWDGELAAAEVRRNAERGVRAVCFSEAPHPLGLPSLHAPGGYWEPFFTACAETGTVVSMHIGSSSKFFSSSPDCPPAVGAAMASSNSMFSLNDWLFCGALVRHPNLTLAFSESQVGWIPYILQRADSVWEKHHAWTGSKVGLPQPPSFYYYRQVYGCVFDDAFGMINIDAVGEDNLTFETDYPHLDGTWPKSREVAAEQTLGLTDEQRYKVIRGNAIRMLGLSFDRMNA